MAEEIVSNVPEAVKRILRFKEVKIHEERKCISAILDFNPEILDVYGYIHGSIIAVLNIVVAESAARLATSSDEYLIVVNTSINFIKQPEVFGDLEIEACVMSRTDKLVLVSSQVRCENIDLSHANFVFVAEKVS